MSTAEIGTCEWLTCELTQSRLLERDRLDPMATAFQKQFPFADANRLAEHLVARGLLTRFQAERALVGDARGLVLGPYALADTVGVGSTGTVYRAIGRADGQPYALKVLPQRSAWNVRLARKQVRAFAYLPPHPAVVPFIDVGTAAGLHYLVWPWAEGESLAAHVRRCGRLLPDVAARVGLRIAEGLYVCHDQGLFHGQLKPSNLLVGPGEQVHILDFGLGALLAENPDESLVDTRSTANATVGMLDCASPESVIDPMNRTPAGDQYSLGCVLYFCLTGQFPFPQATAVEKIKAHQSLQAPAVRLFNEQVPAGFSDLIDRLMRKAPEGRFPGMAEVAAALQPFAVPAPLPTAGVSMPTPLPVKTLSDLGIVAPPWPASGLLPRPTLGASSAPVGPPPVAPPMRAAPAVAARRPSLLGRLFGWCRSGDAVDGSLFAPAMVRPGETLILQLFAHPPESAEAVRTLARAFQPANQPHGTQRLAASVPQRSDLEVRIELGGLTVAQPPQPVAWQGQPVAVSFPVRVPSDFPPGEVVGVVSVARKGALVGRIEFRLTVLY